MNFLYFILGILFIEAIIPILESLVEVIAQWVEFFKGKAAIKVKELSLKAAELTKQITPDETSIRAIGFTVSNDDETYEEEEDDE